MLRIPIAVLSGALGLALLAGCETMEERFNEIAGDDDDDEPRVVAFDCDDDRDLRVRLSGDRDEARVSAGDEVYELERTGRDDGRQVYSNDDGVRLEISNEEAYLRVPGGEDFQDCQRS
ncbi:MAG TPA: hypothetical protein VFZ10_18770 [Geminicoccaceae bacterium]